MLCVVIKGPSFEEIHQQISNALEYADVIELRLDCFEHLDLTALKNLRSLFSIPMIFTLRSALQGGNYKQSEENRLADIRTLLECKPDYLDLENHIPRHFVEDISSRYPEIKLIVSYHNFTETPEDLESLYQEMTQTPAFFYKIAVTAANCLDALRFVCWAKKFPQLISISMGPHGQISRILGPVIGCPMTYTSLSENQQTAPGQLSAQTLIDLYHYRSLNSQTALYGLIGDPVDKSISEHTHNLFFSTCGLNGIYIKIQVKPSELGDFLHFTKQLPFKGISVTMPLKEHVLPYLDHIDAQARDIGAVNTLLFEKDKISGFNTDGIGALNVIEQVSLVKGKHIVIIGAGGSTKAIAYEALRRGALVTLINRTKEKARLLAQHLHCKSAGLEDMPTCAKAGYDILINCTPIPLPIDPKDILSQAIVMDIVTKPKETEFLKEAKAKGCRVLYGYQMFVEQAIGQFHLWFKDRINTQKCRMILENKALECVTNKEEGVEIEIDGKKFVFSLAINRSDFQQSYKLIYDLYSQEGFVKKPNESNFWLSLYNALHDTATLTVKHENTIIASSTLVSDSPIGLPADDLYKGEIDKFRAASIKLVEGISFGISNQFQHNPHFFSKLLHAIILYAHQVSGGAYFIVTIHPKRLSYYEKIGFEQLGPLRTYEKVNNNPAILIGINSQNFAARFREERESRFALSTSSFFSNALSENQEIECLQFFKYYHQPMSEADRHYFFVEKSSLLAEATDLQRDYLRIIAT